MSHQSVPLRFGPRPWARLRALTGVEEMAVAGVATGDAVSLLDALLVAGPTWALAPGSAAERDFKSRLQERSQALLQKTPQYNVVGQDGPDHDKTFGVSIALGDQEYGRASGKSKKEAEQSAAALALAKLEGRAE